MSYNISVCGLFLNWYNLGMKLVKLVEIVTSKIIICLFLIRKSKEK